MRLERIGPFRILQSLGRGSNGEVFLAEQSAPRRRVALKVLRSDVVDPRVHSRMLFEAETLARLEHPGIARIYEAGLYRPDTGEIVTPTNPYHDHAQPYFVMQHIDGVDVTAHARAAKLGTEARLRLMATICDAVDYAHSRGVLHRDLKPANLLVDADGRPYVLDFGVARLLDGDRDLTLQTQVGELLGTVPYMSPEQIRADPDALDTRSDVYALGVVLYELLTGRLPYDLARKTLQQALRAIVEDSPPRLGTLDHTHAGDVEVIVAKALEKEPARRYSSAAELAADVRRHLAREPILARAASIGYVLTRYAARNRAAVLAFAAVTLTIAAGLAGTSYWALRAQHAENAALEQRDRANYEADSARTVARFLAELFMAPAPGNARGETLTARDMLERGRQQLATEIDDRPLVRADLEHTLAEVYRAMGMPDDAIVNQRNALRLRERHLGTDAIDTLNSVNSLGVIELDRGRYEDAEPLLRRAHEGRARVLGAEHVDTLASANNLGLLSLFRGEHEEALSIFEDVRAVQLATVGPEHPDTLTSNENIANALVAAQKHDSALDLYEEVLDARRRILGVDHPDTLRSLGNVSGALYHLGKHELASRTFGEALEIQQRIMGPDHPDTLRTRGNLAECYRQLGRLDKAEPLFASTLAGQRRILGDRHAETILTIGNFGELLRARGDTDRALLLLEEAVRANLELYPLDSLQVAFSRHNLACAYRDTGRHAESRRLFELAQRSIEDAVGVGHLYSTVNLTEFAALLRTIGDVEGADRLESRILSTDD